MNKKDVIDFFDRCANWWDDDMIRNEKVINQILENSKIEKGVHVLDVACGTGVLFKDYLNLEVASLTGIDISSEMVKVAQNKFPNINVICGDVETYSFNQKFDRIMVYNAFPHFSNPRRLIECLSNLLDTHGRLSIAHGMSRETLLKHHEGRASHVSIDLLELNELVELLKPMFEIEVAISNDEMYQVVGRKR